MKEQTRLQLAVELNEVIGEYLPMLRMGAMLYHARPELGHLLVEIMKPEVPTGASEELRESALRLVSSDDNLLQIFIDVLTEAQERTEKED